MFHVVIFSFFSVSVVLQYPVLLTFIGYDRLLGSHYDEYTIVYQDFSTEVNPSVFDIDFSGCEGFPGPGVTLPMAENHAFAFFGASGYNAKHHSHKVDTEFNDFREKYVRGYDDDKVMEQRKFHFRHNHR